MPANAALLAARLLLAFLFLFSGLSALGDIAGTTEYFSSLGLPAPSFLAWATCLFELAAGVLIVIGFQTRAAALLLAAFSVAAASSATTARAAATRRSPSCTARR